MKSSVKAAIFSVHPGLWNWAFWNIFLRIFLSSFTHVFYNSTTQKYAHRVATETRDQADAGIGT
jgi:hypothetical protein